MADMSDEEREEWKRMVAEGERWNSEVKPRLFAQLDQTAEEGNISKQVLAQYWAVITAYEGDRWRKEPDSYRLAATAILGLETIRVWADARGRFQLRTVVLYIEGDAQKLMDRMSGIDTEAN